MRQKSPEKEARIAEAALELFLSRGISKTSMNAIAQKAGVAVGTLYIYYADKDQVVLACARDFARQHMAQIESIMKSRRRAGLKLKSYILGRYDMWQKFTGYGPPEEMAEAIFRLDPDGLKNFERNFRKNVVMIIEEGCRNEEWQVKPTEKLARHIQLATAHFFPLAGNFIPNAGSRKELSELLDWLVSKFKD